MVKTNRIVRLTESRIKVVLDPKHGKATNKRVHSLLAHDVGAVIRRHCPMNDGYWKKISEDTKKDLITEITVNFDIDTKISENYEYINDLMARRYREFKFELHDYYLEFGSPNEALANPPIEMDTRPGQWEVMCEHFQSERFLKQSNANKNNRSKRPNEHHAGSCPLVYIVEECAEAGSQFPEIDAFEIAYGGKSKNITNDTAKAKFDEMVAKKDEYIKELAKDYPEDTPLQAIKVTDNDAGLKIVKDVLGAKPGKEFRGLGVGRVRDFKGSSLRARQLEEQLATEREARQAAEERVNAADAARVEAQQSLALLMQSWEQTMQQLAQRVPGFVPPPVIVPPQSNSDQDVGEEDDDINA